VVWGLQWPLTTVHQEWRGFGSKDDQNPSPRGSSGAGRQRNPLQAETPVLAKGDRAGTSRAASWRSAAMMAGLPCESSGVKATGKRSAGKSHAAFDEGEQANAARMQLVRHRQTKGAETDRLGPRSREPALYSTGHTAGYRRCKWLQLGEHRPGYGWRAASAAGLPCSFQEVV